MDQEYIITKKKLVFFCILTCTLFLSVSVIGYYHYSSTLHRVAQNNKYRTEMLLDNIDDNLFVISQGARKMSNGRKFYFLQSEVGILQFLKESDNNMFIKTNRDIPLPKGDIYFIPIQEGFVKVIIKAEKGSVSWYYLEKYDSYRVHFFVTFNEKVFDYFNTYGISVEDSWRKPGNPVINLADNSYDLNGSNDENDKSMFVIFKVDPYNKEKITMDLQNVDASTETYSILRGEFQGKKTK